MTRLTSRLLALIAYGVFAFGPIVTAQNLLTNNPGFEAKTAYYTPGWGFPQGSPDVLPGWIITLGGDGYAGASANQGPQELEGIRYGYIYSGTGPSGILETAPEFRAPVEKDTAYTLWFLARCDVSWSDASLTVSLVWHPNRNNEATVGDPTNLNLTLPMIVSPADPMQTFNITAVAPAGAHYASVRITRPPNDYAPVIVDDFVIMAEPTNVSLTIKKQGSQGKLSWPRSRKFRLQKSNGLSPSNGWEMVNKPVKGIGDRHEVEPSLTEPVQFFRLAEP